MEGPETEKKHVELADKGWTGCPCGSNVAPQSGGENVCQMCGAVFDHSRLGEGSCDGFFLNLQEMVGVLILLLWTSECNIQCDLNLRATLGKYSLVEQNMGKYKLTNSVNCQICH